MQPFIRVARIAGIVIAAVALWGASMACETDKWRSERRIQNAPTATAQNPPDTSLPNISVSDRTEADLVQEMMLHRAMYARYLHVLATYYREHGYENKARWARIELKDLRNVRPYGSAAAEKGDRTSARDRNTAAIENPAGLDLPRITVANRAEVDVVEEMMLHRSMYLRYLRVLRNYYSEHGQENNANVIRTELNDLQTVKAYQYVTETEVPDAPLKPLESIADADQMFDQAYKKLMEGGHHVLFFYNHATMNVALSKFKELIDKYPTSDKIDDAAYFIAEIHKEYNQERDNEIAIQWYQKAIAWNSDLDYPAWSHVAHIYDFRMHEREQALEWYQKVLVHEKDKHGWRFAKNIAVANKRIAELTVEDTRHSPGDSPGQDDRRAATPPPTPAPAPAAAKPAAPTARSGSEASPPAPRVP